ncbi:hypothetical protein FOA52_008574 [Chlamydomonas sp. UWO 241]|nr:hypothetical protein FOA52_008574 [Chlamydomonas sp. UWO 241]
MSKTVYMRGLNNFIQEIRDAKNHEQEAQRVEKELAKIREKFGDDKGLTAYDKRKYVWKLLYIHMLGYNIDFGHKQACDLIPKPKYKDKQVGYMACAILMSENDEFLRLSINAVHVDLISRNEAFECLALNFVGSVGGREMAEALVPDILKLLSNGSSRPLVKKRAALCLLRMMRRTPPGQEVVHPDTFCSILNDLLEERDLGLLLSTVTLLLGILARNGPAGYEPTQARLLRILERMILVEESAGRDVPPEYLFYGVPCPWLQSKTLRALQHFLSPEIAEEKTLLNSILETVITTVPTAHKSNPNKANALHSITFEGLQLVLLKNDCEPTLRAKAVETLSRLLDSEQANVVYLSLEMLSRLTSAPDVLAAIRERTVTVMSALKGPDANVRRKALDLLFATCDASNAEALVAELLEYFGECDYTLKEELVLKIAILAEKFAPTVQWYVDTALALLERAGDFVSDDIWQRTAQLVTNNDSMQQYAAREVVSVLRRGGVVHESMVSTAAYVLGEYGRLVAAEVAPAEQFKLLQGLLATATAPTRGLLYTAFIKLYLQAPNDSELRSTAIAQFQGASASMDADLQQRAAEYLALAAAPSEQSTKFVLPMPKWPERESTLLRQLQKKTLVDDDAEAKEAAIALAAAAAASAGTSAQPPLASAGVSAAATPTAAGAAGAGNAMGSVSSTLSAARSVNLLGSDASSTGAAAAAAVAAEYDPFAALAGGAPQAPQPAVDMFADMFGTTPAPPAPAPRAPPAAPAAAAAAAAAADPFASWSGPAAASPPAAAYPGSFSPPAAAAAATARTVFPDSPTPFPSAAAPPAPGGFGSSADPFGDDSAFGPPPVPAAVFPPAVPSVDLAACFGALLYKDRGVVYEDQYVQAGLQLTFAGSTGSATLFLGNKQQQHALTSVNVTAASSSSVAAALGSPAPGTIAPGQQAQVSIRLSCTGPVSLADTPTFVLSYVIGNVAVAQTLRVPVSPHRFLAPDHAISKEVFFEQWKSTLYAACSVRVDLNKA